jgi:hypothetical protein
VSSGKRASARRKWLAALAPLSGFALLVGVMATGALGSTVSSAAFGGGAGTVSVGGTLYAKQGAALTLTVNTSSDTQCVDITGAYADHQTSTRGKSSWTFSFTAGSGDGLQKVTAAAYANFNGTKCTGTSSPPVDASFVLDNTGPQVSGSLTPAPNGAGWNNSNVSVAWAAADVGSGVASGPTPASDSQTSNTTTGSVTKTATATDRLGNSASGSVTIKLDKSAPTITGSRSPAPNADGWNNTDVTASFACSDGLSGIKSCPGATTLTSSGANQSVTRTAVDNADNSATATVSGVNIDKVAPTLTGAPATSPNAHGWYNGNVTIHWTASDVLSGLTGSAPADSTIAGEGTGLTASASVSDKAGNTTNATSSPGVKIDKTPPVTTATAPTNWNNSDVTVSFAGADALSGVASTYYKLDGGAQQTGTSVRISDEGSHTLDFWSVDNAGNVEPTNSVKVNIDKTPPTINHAFDPQPNANGWLNDDVKVTFSCADMGGSGISSCTEPQTVTSEGKDQTVTGTATDTASNTATDPAKVSIDKTAPTIKATADRSANASGWYDAGVRVSFACADALSGIDTCPTPKTVGEGADQSANATAADAAGNTATAGVAHINVDETAPTLAGKPESPANADGWYSDDVTVDWSCADGLSGLAGDCPSSSTVTGEGSNLSASASIADNAGNVAQTTLDGIKIDRTAPVTAADVPAPLDSGWYAGAVKVTLNALDSLSGVAQTYYSVDDGNATSYTGPFDVADKGTHEVHFWSVDRAGNLEDRNASGHTVELKIDGVAPRIEGHRTPAANEFGWNNADVTASFACADDESGIADCSAPATLSKEGASQSVDGTARDNAGNTSQASVKDINIDKTAPTLVGAPTTDANAAGWYRDDVTIHWTATDGLSGVDPATQPADSVVTGEGENLSSDATVSDKAGNATTATVDHIKIDRTPPTTTAALGQALDTGWYATAVKVTLNGHDDLSGLDETFYSIDGGDAQRYSGPFDFADKGVHTITFWSVDNAGNTEDKTADGRTVTVKIDNVPPTISGDRTPAANANGWNNGPVTVKFSCSDAESGIAGCEGPTTLSDDGAGQSVTGNAADNAGNTAKATVDDINIDQVKPNIASRLPDPNGIDLNGEKWYTGDVSVTWVCSDGLSGIDDSCPANSTISGEGRNRGAGPVSVSDKAGNTSSVSVGDVNIDRTGPTIKGAPTTEPNDAGWYNGLVNVRFQCDDPALDDGSLGSGVATCPSDIAITKQGTDLSVTSAPAKDSAGNSTSGRTVGGINVDSTAPISSDTASCTLVGGYCNGTAPVSVTISASDPTPDGVTGVSGVKEIRYSKDGGGTWTTASGSALTVPLTLSDSGKATIAYYAVDKADNEEIAHTDSIDYDGTAPTVTHTLSPTANAAGWSKADTLVHFSAKDDPNGSGVNAASVTPDRIYSTETADQTISGSADDNAGNRGTDSFHFYLDKTAPTISAATTPGNPDGTNGWYIHAVTVTFDCSDPTAADGATGSGVAACPNPVTLSGNGANQSVTRTVSDKADNTASKTVSGINIDMETPTLTIGGVKDGGIYLLGSVPTPTCNATDSVSGVAGCTGSVTGGLPNGVGTFTYTATATDKAGNAVTQSVTYKVIYNVAANVAFFLQPINDTAHTTSSTLSIFKGGQTVPVKFQLKNAAGQVVQANSAPVWTVPAKGNATSSAVNEDVFSATSDSASTFRWDSSTQQYIYNWNTASAQAGYYWKIGVKLDDGQTQYVDIGLR